MMYYYIITVQYSIRNAVQKYCGVFYVVVYCCCLI